MLNERGSVKNRVELIGHIRREIESIRERNQSLLTACDRLDDWVYSSFDVIKEALGDDSSSESEGEEEEAPSSDDESFVVQTNKSKTAKDSTKQNDVQINIRRPAPPKLQIFQQSSIPVQYSINRAPPLLPIRREAINSLNHYSISSRSSVLPTKSHANKQIVFPKLDIFYSD